MVGGRRVAAASCGVLQPLRRPGCLASRQLRRCWKRRAAGLRLTRRCQLRGGGAGAWNARGGPTWVRGPYRWTRPNTPPPPPDPESAAAGISQRLWEIVPDRTVLVVADIPTAADVPRVEIFAQAAAVFWMHPTGSPNVRRVTCEKWAAMYGDPPVESIYKADAQTWLWYPKGSFEPTPGSVRQRQLVRDRRVAELTDWARERHPEPLLSRDVRERFDVSRQTAVETMKKAGLKKVGRARAACWYLDPPAGDSQER